MISSEGGLIIWGKNMHNIWRLPGGSRPGPRAFGDTGLFGKGPGIFGWVGLLIRVFLGWQKTRVFLAKHRYGSLQKTHGEPYEFVVRQALC